MPDIDLNSIKIFRRNGDAVSTNRGFYYQYLSLLKKWITNFINGAESTLYTEVDNDIKEIGKTCVFTQLKCYSSDFSLNSKEIRHSLFDFFITYLRYKQNNITPKFSFVTNSGIQKKEKLLGKWFSREIFKNTADIESLKKKNREILKGESNKIRQAKLNCQNVSAHKKLEVNTSYKALCSILLDDLLIEDFCRTVHWEFGELTTEDAVFQIRQEILVLLKNKIFGDRPIEIIFRVLLSEINRCSQESEASMRCLTTSDLQDLLDLSDSEIKARIDSKFIQFIGFELEEIKDRIKTVESKQENQAARIENLKPNTLENIDLTLVPYVNDLDIIFGWNNEFKDTFDILSKKKLITIHNYGGVGKTTFAKKFLTINRNKYNNVIWLNIEKSIQTSFVFNNLLLSSLRINLDKEKTVDEQFNIILAELGKIGDNNLIILDIQDNDETSSALDRIVSLRNWKKMILTRARFKTLNPYLLPHLDYDSAGNLFKLHCSKDFNEAVFKAFLEYIEFNTLIIELVAKTIENGFDLTLEFIFESIKTQNLNNELLKIDIGIYNVESKVAAIFDFILQKFSVEGINDNEEFFLEYLALLPSTDIIIEDLILICGKEFYDGNKISYINCINSLEKKGLLQYEDNKKSIRVHKILQQTIIYRLRGQNSPFVEFSFYISWLARRIAEGYNNPKGSFRFLKYAESILNTIKEEYRSNIYQPLLLLENEYLHLSSFFFIRNNIDELWADLIKRTEHYLGKDALCLGAMYNNLASTLNIENSLDDIINYQRKANKLYSQHSGDFKNGDLLMFITSLQNLAQAYLLKDEPENVLKCLQKVAVLRKQNYFYNDAQVGVEYTILSELHRKTKNFDISELLITKAIKYHNSIPAEKRNELLLSSYYNKLSESCILKNNLDEAIAHQLKCVEILDSERIKNTHVVKMYQFLIELYKVSNDMDGAAIYSCKLDLLIEQNKN
ncbi:hypothetical protein [Chryseobacterium sp. SIMBA_029]|uniref:hypothetical protein n=1 Tax=Chryseobacterium sp. SIMBA_029 TaxID=3085772 RepID=UPI003979E961